MRRVLLSACGYSLVSVHLASDRRIAGQGISSLVVCAMNKAIGFQLVVYGLLLAGLSYLVHHLAPASARPTLITGLAGGALCLVWGVRAIGGSRGKALPLLTLVAVNFVVLSQTVMRWGGGSQEVTGHRTAVALIALLLALSVGMLFRIAYAGAVADAASANPPKEGGAKPQAPVKAPQANAGKRA
jgi:hypothetical protein